MRRDWNRRMEDRRKQKGFRGWYVQRNPLRSRWCILSKGDVIVCEAWNESTAHLLSAAPELYEAAKEALGALEDLDGTHLRIHEKDLYPLQEAIDKAEGEGGGA